MSQPTTNQGGTIWWNLKTIEDLKALVAYLDGNFMFFEFGLSVDGEDIHDVSVNTHVQEGKMFVEFVAE